LPINYRQRLGNSNTYFLLLLWVIVAGYISINIISNIFFEQLGVGLLMRYLGSRIEKHKQWEWLIGFLGTLEKEPEGNPAYFEAIPDKTMMNQLKAGTVSGDIYFRYMVELDYRGYPWRAELEREEIDWKAKLVEYGIDWETAFDNLGMIKSAEEEHDQRAKYDDEEEEHPEGESGSGRGKVVRRKSVHVRTIVDGKLQVIKEPIWAQASKRSLKDGGEDEEEEKSGWNCNRDCAEKCRKDCSDPQCSKDCQADCEKRCPGCTQERQAAACQACCEKVEEEDAQNRFIGGLESYNVRLLNFNTAYVCINSLSRTTIFLSIFSVLILENYSITTF
jgi:hypothetical protein